MLSTLKEQYTACCNAYADLLIKLMGQTWQTAYWVRGRIGGVLDIAGEYCIDMLDIAYIIDHSMTYDEIIAWHTYNSAVPLIELLPIDIDAWHNGAEHASDADINLLLELKDEVLTAATDEGTDSPNYSNAKRKFNIARERILNSMHIYESNT